MKQTEKGVEGLQKACNLRSDNKQFYIGQIVHKSCRQNYCNPHVIKKDLKRQLEENVTEQQCTPRSKTMRFDFTTQCLFCGQVAKHSKRKNYSVYHVRSLTFQEQIEQCCIQCGADDKWAESVLGRIKGVHDLPAAEALYHQQCSANFRTGKCIPST